MNSRWYVVTLGIVLASSLPGPAQTSASNVPVKDDYSQEAAVIEKMSTKMAFENDGNFTREQASRVRVQTDAGVQQWGLLTFPFQSATQTVEVDYVRVRKADGSTLVTPPDNIQDLDSEITRSAPFYSDLREKHVAVKGLAKGDILEYGAHWRTTKPLIPGQFWFQYNFHHEGVVLDERLEVKVPVERAVKLKAAKGTQTVAADAASRTYLWTYSKLQSAKEPGSDEKKIAETARGQLPPPDVQISSFQNWDEVGRWYWNLQKERIDPTPAIRAKAEELTKGMTDDASKMRALYSFVSTQYRYIGIAFGIGRYQPHAADDVLTNSYGDCKDKHTLLASLLQASGITIHPALISSSWKLDPDVPSPAQFDHIIGYLPQGKGRDAIWLDTTIEIAPFGYLVPRLRDKPALVMSDDKSIQLVTTPIDAPLPDSEAFKIGGKFSDDGTFDAKIEDTTRGDAEVSLRAAFRQTPQPQWKDLMQRISYAMGYSGTVSDMSASKPEAVSEPFHIAYSYNRKDYPDWKSDKRITVPGIPFFMPTVHDDSIYPVWLGSPMEAVSDSTVELPHGYEPQLPPNVDLKYDFAEYHASYSQDHSVLTAKRRLITKLREVPVSEFGDYRSFVKNLNDDVNRYVYATSSVASNVPPQPANAPGSANVPSFIKEMMGLPDSGSSNANQLEADGRNDMRLGDKTAALNAFRRALDADPKFTRAVLELVVVYMTTGKSDPSLDVLRKAIESDPKQLMTRKAYAFLLTSLRRFDAATDAWREILKIAPDDPEANTALAEQFMRQKRYSEALPFLETATKTDDSPIAQIRLGTVYIRSGQSEKGKAILEKIVGPDSTPDILNDVAYEMADANVNLSKALEYALHAVDVQEEESHGAYLSNLLPEDLVCTRKIAMFWDTLGWAHFRLGHLDRAESYLHAAWLLSQGAAEADHLGQVYEQQKKTEKAIHMYRLALATPEAHAPGGSWDETRHRLEHLTGGNAPTAIDLLRADPSGSELSELRTVKLKRLVPGTAEAEFFLIFGPGPKVEGLQFVSGNSKLRLVGKEALSQASFQVAFPEHSSARLIRRGILMCTTESGCNAVLFTPDSVTSVK